MKEGGEMKLRNVVIAVVLCLFVAVSVSAQQRGTPAEAKAMVEKAMAYIKANGQEKAFAEINNPRGKFVDRDLYIMVYDMNGTCLAHGANKERIGKNFMDSKDDAGNLVVKQRVEMAKTKGSGWQDYVFANPISKKVEPKTAYFEKYGDIIVSCGAYKPGK
jgi:sensor histidine kinase regulating citrate/malate metabolism